MPTLSLSSPLAIDCWLPRSSHESVHVERERLDSCTCFCPWENAHPGNVSTRACTASLANARSRGTSLYTARLPAALLRGPERRLDGFVILIAATAQCRRTPKVSIHTEIAWFQRV